MGKGSQFRTRIPAAVAATALVCVILVSFTGVRDSGTAEVRRMLEKRTAIMENVLSGRITYDEGKSELMEIEDGSLLSDDLGSLKSYEDTDYEPVYDMIFAGIEITGSVYGTSCYECRICWVYSDHRGLQREMAVYRAGTRLCGGTLKLVMFEPDEDTYSSGS